jgi:hypothetical protein
MRENSLAPSGLTGRRPSAALHGLFVVSATTDRKHKRSPALALLWPGGLGVALARLWLGSGWVELSGVARRRDSRVGENRLGDQNRGATGARKRGWIVLECGPRRRNDRRPSRVESIKRRAQ